mgnify:CR=1 FL=1
MKTKFYKRQRPTGAAMEEENKILQTKVETLQAAICK